MTTPTHTPAPPPPAAHDGAPRGASPSARSRSAGSARMSRLVANTITYVFLLAGAVLMVAPFLFSVLTSLKTRSQFNTTWPLTLPDPVTAQNYIDLFTGRYNFIVPIAGDCNFFGVTPEK